MTYNLNRLVAVLALAGVSFAQAQQVVPPPQPPGAAALPPLVNAAPQKPVVAPPLQAASVNPAAAAPQVETAPVARAAPLKPNDLLDIALPAAPKPDPVIDLVPKAPKASEDKGNAKGKGKAPTSKAQPKTAGEAETKVEKPLDPFSGIAGTPVSEAQLNRFVFPEAVEGIYFSEGAPLPDCPENAKEQDPCKPVFLNGKKMMLLQLRAGAKGPVQMLVHLHSGRVVTLNLMPAPGPGAVVRIDGAEDGASDARLAVAAAEAAASPRAEGMTASENNVELLSRIARGDIPAGFEPAKVNKEIVRFELFQAEQMASWDNEAGLRAHMFRISAYTEQPVVIGPALFRYQGVKAVALDRETITKQEPAILFLLEQAEVN